jgi:hypothetical protein
MKALCKGRRATIGNVSFLMKQKIEEKCFRMIIVMTRNDL